MQVLLQDTQPGVVIRVAKWIQENKKVVIITKPTVYVAIAVLEHIVDRLEQEGCWKSLLELELDNDSAEKRSVFMGAALHPVGHLLAREMVAKVNHVGESCKEDLMRVLASRVDLLSSDKFGGIVLKGLIGSLS